MALKFNWERMTESCASCVYFKDDPKRQGERGFCTAFGVTNSARSVGLLFYCNDYTERPPIQMPQLQTKHKKRKR